MSGDVGDVVAAVDQPFGIDQVAVPAREVRELVGGVAGDAVALADSMIQVAQQAEREPLRRGEGPVGGWFVEGRSEDDDPEIVESIGAVTQRLAFDRSTGGCGLGVPPQEHPPASQVGEVDDGFVLIRQPEGRGLLS